MNKRPRSKWWYKYRGIDLKHPIQETPNSFDHIEVKPAFDYKGVGEEIRISYLCVMQRRTLEIFIRSGS